MEYKDSFKYFFYLSSFTSFFVALCMMSLGQSNPLWEIYIELSLPAPEKILTAPLYFDHNYEQRIRQQQSKNATSGRTN